MKIEQLSMLATVVVAFVALAALVLTGQAGIRQHLRAMQTDPLVGQAALREEMLAGQAKLRAGRARIREDLAALGGRLVVVEHRTDALDVRYAQSERRPEEWPVVSDSPAVGSGSPAPPAVPRSGTTRSADVGGRVGDRDAGVFEIVPNSEVGEFRICSGLGILLAERESARSAGDGVANSTLVGAVAEVAGLLLNPRLNWYDKPPMSPAALIATSQNLLPLAEAFSFTEPCWDSRT